MSRIADKHVNELAELLKGYDTPVLRAEYLKAKLTDMRYRWDVLWRASDAAQREFVKAFAAGRMTNNAVYAWCQARYEEGCNDTHIDTVLRRLIPNLNGEENSRKKNS